MEHALHVHNPVLAQANNANNAKGLATKRHHACMLQIGTMPLKCAALPEQFSMWPQQYMLTRSALPPANAMRQNAQLVVLGLSKTVSMCNPMFQTGPKTPRSLAPYAFAATPVRAADSGTRGVLGRLLDVAIS